MPHQQNLAGFAIALVTIQAPSNDIKDLRPALRELLRVLATTQSGQVVRIAI
jgi:hypothetical protein